MFRFFRQIRLKLLSQNNVSKYLFYAIGEIVLVVIGILIALQIDNWNDENQKSKTETVYLESLKDEFAYNLSVLEQTMKENSKLIQDIDILTNVFDKHVLDSISEKQVAFLLNPLGKEVIYYPASGVLTDIVSSGNLKLIKNDTLRQKLASFNNVLNRIKDQEKVASGLRDNLMQIASRNGSFPLMFHYLEGGTPDQTNIKSNKLLFTVPEFENNLELYKRISETTNSFFYSQLKENIEEIIQTITEELKKD